jgi:hypothetical protein
MRELDTALRVYLSIYGFKLGSYDNGTQGYRYAV